MKHLLKPWTNTELIVSSRKGDIQQLSREASETFDVVVACGGDGTVREVAMGLLHSKAVMGIVPLGSGNDFSKSIGLTRSLEMSLRIIKQGKTGKVDMGKCNDIYFLNTLGIGFDGLTNRYAMKSSLPGSLKYIWGAIKANLKLKPVNGTITAPGMTRHQSFLMITLANGRVEGGCFNVAPDALLNDGVLDVITVSPVSKAVLPFLLPLFVFGRQHVLKQVDLFKTDTIKINLERSSYLHADGEVIVTDETEFEVILEPSSLEVIGTFN